MLTSKSSWRSQSDLGGQAAAVAELLCARPVAGSVAGACRQATAGLSATDRTRGSGEGLPAAESPQSCHHRRGCSAAAPAMPQRCCLQSHCRTVRVSMRLRHRTVDGEQSPMLSLRQIRAPFFWASIDITAESTAVNQHPMQLPRSSCCGNSCKGGGMTHTPAASIHNTYVQHWSCDTNLRQIGRMRW